MKTKPIMKSPRKVTSVARPKSVPKSVPASSGNIRVIVRVRPPNNREGGDNYRNIIKIKDDFTLIFDPKEEEEPFFYHGVQQRNWDITKRANKNLNFIFDRVFGYDARNLDIFEDSTKSLIENLMQGYNCSVFVYGATGAGKTHTMIGSHGDPGITSQTVTKLFEEMEKLAIEREFEIGMSYLEVYNESVQDLLSPGPALQLRENGKYGVFVSGLEVHRIDNPNKLFDLLDKGNRNRTQHPTDANAESSRSHAVFQVYLKMKMKVSGEVRGAKLSMIDLAGSERGAATGFTGARFTEGANINKSLLALGNCINSLADGHRHVPYRDSKLTRLLKDSLGGNCRTVMITNVSPSFISYEDTYNTLKYALRAKKIKSNVMKNVVNTEGNLNHYIKVCDELKRENEELKLQLSLLTQNQSSEQTSETQVSPKPSSDADKQLKIELESYYREKIEILEQIYQYESLDELALLRKQLKEDCNTRVSGICTNSVEKKRGHQRFQNSCKNLERQATNFKKEVLRMKQKCDIISEKIKELLETNPMLNVIADAKEAHVNKVISSKKVEHLEKVSDIQKKQISLHGSVIEACCNILKPCFMQLRGHGFATDGMVSDYQSLVGKLQGIKSVNFDMDHAGDSAISSTNTVDSDAAATTSSDLNCTVVIEKKPEASGDVDILDNTFILPSSKPVLTENGLSKARTPTAKKDVSSTSNSTRILVPHKQNQSVSAKNLMVKLYKHSPPKKRLLRNSPKNKENRNFVRPAASTLSRLNNQHPVNKAIRSTSTSRLLAPLRK